jgi:hypothetical protein
MYMRRGKSGPTLDPKPREFAIRLITIRKMELTFSYLDWFERTVLPHQVQSIPIAGRLGQRREKESKKT